MGNIKNSISTNKNDRRKIFLQSYGKHVRRVNRIEAEISDIRAMKMSPSMSQLGMPRGTGKTDLSCYAAKLDELEGELVREQYRQIMLYQDIVRAIKELDNENEKDILFYRYIKEMDWWEIAEKMRYSERWIHKLHGRALELMEVPKEFS